MNRIPKTILPLSLLVLAMGLSAMACEGGSGEEPQKAASTASPSATAASVEAKGTLTWTGCGITKRAFMEELARAYKKKTGVEILISGGGATKGIRDPAAGRSDLGGSCRHKLDVPEEEAAELIQVAWDAVVVVVHADNPVTDISRKQLEGVFSGRIDNWDALGAPSDYGKINVHVREGKTSGVGLMGRLFVFKDVEFDYKATKVHASTGPLERTIGSDRQGVGLTGIASASRQKRLKMLKLNGIEPTAANVINGSYTLSRPLHLVVHRDNRDKGPVADFVRFALSAEGQKAIAATGTIPINDVPATVRSRYDADLTGRGQDDEAAEGEEKKGDGAGKGASAKAGKAEGGE